MGAFILGVRTVLPDTANPVLRGGERETLEGLTRIRATATSIAVVHRSDRDDPSTEQVIEIHSEEAELDLVTDLDDPSPRLLAFLNVPAGFVYQMRVIVSSLEVTLDGETFDVKTPSAAQSGLKIEPIDGEPFEVIAQERTGARVVFEPFEQLLRNRGVGFLMKPVLGAEPISADDLLGFIADQIVVGFDPTLSDADIDDINDDIGATILYCHRPTRYCTMHLPIDVLFVDALEFYARHDDVRYVLPNQWVPQLAEPPPFDPLYLMDNQLHFRQISVYGDDPAEGAWDHTQGSFDIVIANPDAGINIDHPDLIANVWINVDEIPDRVLAAVGDFTGDGILDFHDLDDRAAGGVGLGDGVLTFADLDVLADDPLLGDAVCPRTNSSPFDRCNPSDLVNGQPHDDSAPYGWQDGLDGEAPDPTMDNKVDDIVGWNFLRDNNRIEALNDHGTVSAGIMAAVSNDLDAVGVNWRGRILAVQPVVGPAGDMARASIILAMQYAVEQGADVINISLGFMASRRPEVTDFCQDRTVHLLQGEDLEGKFDDYVEGLHDEIADVPLTETLLAAAAGNCAHDHDTEGVFAWPPDLGGENGSRIPSMIRVGGVDASDNLWFTRREPLGSSGSDFGPAWVDIAAPSVAIFSLDRVGTTTDPTDTTGTSFAAPQVAGVAALVLSTDPSLRRDGCRLADRVLRNADTGVGNLSGRVAGGRRLNALAAVLDASPAPVRPCD
jgi:subtilisin family serine protease